MCGFFHHCNCGHDGLWFDTSSFLCLTSSVKKWLSGLVQYYHPLENQMYVVYHFLRKRNCQIHNVCLHTEQRCMANDLKFYFKMHNKLPICWHPVNQKTPESSFVPEQWHIFKIMTLPLWTPWIHLWISAFKPSYSKHNPWTSPLIITWETVRYAEAWPPNLQPTSAESEWELFCVLIYICMYLSCIMFH